MAIDLTDEHRTGSHEDQVELFKTGQEEIVSNAASLTGAGSAEVS